MLKTSLKSFLSVVRHGSIRAASAELNLAQSAISRQLQALEHEVGALLLERRPRGVVLTEAGSLLLQYGRSATFDVDRLLSEMDALRGLQRGHLRIAAIESMVPALLPQVIDRFRCAHPGVTFAVDVLTTDQVLADLRAGDADIGVGFSPQPGPDITVYHRVEEPLLAVMAVDHPLAALDRVTLADIVRHPLGLPSNKSGARFVFDEACRRAGVTARPLLETSSMELLHRFALLGNGVTVLLRHTIGESVERGTLRAVQLGDGVLGGTLEVLTLQDRTLPLASERFLAYLRDGLDAIPMPPPCTGVVSLPGRTSPHRRA